MTQGSHDPGGKRLAWHTAAPVTRRTLYVRAAKASHDRGRQRGHLSPVAARSRSVGAASTCNAKREGRRSHQQSCAGCTSMLLGGTRSLITFDPSGSRSILMTSSEAGVLPIHRRQSKPHLPCRFIPQPMDMPRTCGVGTQSIPHPQAH